MLIPFVFKKKKIEIDNNKWGIIMGIILTICMAVSFKQNILLGQAEAINGQFSGEGTVDIISYGHYGCSLVIIGVFYYLTSPN